jgi:hypothetical protein
MLLDLAPIGDPIRTTLFLAVGGIGLLVLWLISRARRRSDDDAR